MCEYGEDHREIYKIDFKEKLKEEIIKCLKKAGNELYLVDSSLISDKTYLDVHAHERSICFRFGTYLNKYIESNSFLKKYDLDAEYNRDIDMIKRLPGWPNGCYPDLILHKRGNNENNILIIECKGWWSSEEAIQNDREKIMQFLGTFLCADHIRGRTGHCLPLCAGACHAHSHYGGNRSGSRARHFN